MTDERRAQRTRSRQRADLNLEVRKPVGAVLSIRVPRDLALAVEEYAHSERTTLSEVVRDAIETFFVHPRVRVSMAMHGTAPGELRLAGTNIEFTVVVPSTLTRTQEFVRG